MAIKFHVKGNLPDMLAAKNLFSKRKRKISAASNRTISPLPQFNALAKALHPRNSIAAKVVDFEKWGHDVICYTLKAVDGELPLFRAGQYVTVRLEIGKSTVCRPYSICSVPNTSYYKIAVRKAGFASIFIQANWKIGDTVTITAPEGNFYYEPLRDEKNVLAIGGGSGITPFLSMAEAIEQGIEDFNMTILFGVKNFADLMLYDELTSIEKRTKGKVKVVFVLSEGKVLGMESGLITASLIKRYTTGAPFSVFLCGSPKMNEFIVREIAKMGLDTKHFRRELDGEIKNPTDEADYPKGNFESRYPIKIRLNGEVTGFMAAANESLLVSFERAGLTAPSRCRGGECGFCRARLISGEVYTSKRLAKLRGADRINDYIHPCVSFPLSALEIEISEDN